jgi:hypothetical protein
LRESRCGVISWALKAWVAFVLLMIAASAEAQGTEGTSGDLPLELSWSAPRECPTQATVWAATRAMIKRLTREVEEHPVRVQVRVWRVREGVWNALIQSEGEGVGGERTLTGARCTDVARAVELVLALTLSADGNLEPPPPEPEPPPPPPPEPPPAARPLPPPKSLAPFVHPALGLAALGGNGAVPGLGVAGQLRALLAFEHASVELRADGFLPRSIHVADKGRARFYAGDVGLAGCYGQARERRIGAQGCGGGELSWARGRSTHIREPGSVSGLWARVFVEAAARVALPAGVMLRLSVEGSRGFATPRFAIHGPGRVYEPAAYALRIGLGAEYHF